jgi:hypothetical protein
MSRKKKLDVGIGAAKAALDRFEAVWKRAERILPSHADLRAGMPRLKKGSEKHVRTERDEC